MTLKTGTRLGAYEITGSLGAGGTLTADSRRMKDLKDRAIGACVG